eukprot:3372107-Pyramimonas_sp.AAC.1
MQVRVDHNCCSRRSRRGARNILDCRWVGKWQWTRGESDPSQKVRIIRMRLTLRGFKDAGPDRVAACADALSRLSQLVVVSEAACRGWAIGAWG